MSKQIDELILGAGEVYLYEFDGAEIPADETIETESNNVGHCSGGFSVEYKPEKYDIKNQYGRTVKSYIIGEEVTAKTGILTWDLEKLSLLSTATVQTSGGKKTLTIGGGGSLRTVLLRFVHTKADGKKLRFTTVGQGGTGFSLEFSTKELTIDATITAVEKIKGFLASLEEEVATE